MSLVDNDSGRGNRLEVSILKSNENLWDALKNEVSVVLDARGYTCIGPGLNLRRDLAQEPCPDKVVIDLDTASLKHYNKGSDTAFLMLRTRCFKCHLAFSIHWLNMRLNSKPPKIDFGPLRKKVLEVVSKPWTLWRIKCKDHAKLPLSQVEQPFPRKVVVLDCEYSAGLKLWELSIVDRATNEVLINTLIKQTDVEADLRLEKFPRTAQDADRWRESNIFHNANPLTLMDVSQVAEALRLKGIAPETVFLVWAVTNFDLAIVREFLERGGHTGILPNDRTCIPMVNYFRHNMKELGMPLRLSNVFELLYPGHDLIGRNHRALPNCQQTMLVLDAFDEFCKPNEERKLEWKLETLAERFSAVAVQAASVSAKRRRTSSTERGDAKLPSSPKRTRLS